MLKGLNARAKDTDGNPQSDNQRQYTKSWSTKQKEDVKKAKMALYYSSQYQTRFESNGLLVQDKKFIIEFQDSDYFGCLIKTNYFSIYKLL